MDIMMILRNKFFHTGCIVTAAVLVFVFLILPLQERVKTESDDTQKFYAKTEHDQRKLTKLPELEVQFEAVKQDEQKVSLLLSESDVVEFIKSVESIAEASSGEVSIAQGTEIDTKRKKPTTKDATMETAKTDDKKKPESVIESLPWEKRLSLRVTFSGAYSDMANFLHRIETMPYRIDVLSLDVRPIDPEEASTKQRPGDLFTASPDANETETTPVSRASEKPSVSAAFDIVVYLK